MSTTLPESHRDLLEQPVVVTLTTVSAEGEPYSVAVWRRWDGQHLLITSDAGTRKHRNAAANPRVAVLALDPNNSQRYLSIRGVVEALDTTNVTAELDRQTQLYTGDPHYFGKFEPVENEATFTGVVLRIRPTRFVTYG